MYHVREYTPTCRFLKINDFALDLPSTAQIRAEGNNIKCVGKKRFNGSVTHGLRKEHVLRSPPLIWTR
jgi:hypothetical protein